MFFESHVAASIGFFSASVGEGQNLERRNVERSVFRNFKIANIKMRKDELFDNSIVEFFFSCFIKCLNNQNI